MTRDERLPAVLVVNAFLRDTTGADRYAADLATLLTGRGHRVAPFAARHRGIEAAEGGEWQRFFPDGADTEAGGRALDVGKFFFHLEARRRARDVAREFRPDVVHAQNLFHHLSPSVLPPLRAGGAAVVMTLHDWKLLCPNYTLYTEGRVCTACRGGRFWNAVVHRCVRDSRLRSAVCAAENALHSTLRLYQRSVDLFVAPSRFLFERFVEFGFPGDKIRVVPHFTPAAPASPVEEGDFVLFAGRLTEAKGVSTLLDAWSRGDARASLRLVIAGDGPLRTVVREEAARRGLERVELPGVLGRQELSRLMSAAVAVVVPSVWYEVFGLVALEAGARGRPVVASRIGGLPEVVEDGVNGLLVPPGDAAALAAAIDLLAAEPALRRRLGEEGLRRAATEFSPERHYGRIRAVYDEAGERSAASA